MERDHHTNGAKSRELSVHLIRRCYFTDARAVYIPHLPCSATRRRPGRGARRTTFVTLGRRPLRRGVSRAPGRRGRWPDPSTARGRGGGVRLWILRLPPTRIGVDGGRRTRRFPEHGGRAFAKSRGETRAVGARQNCCQESTVGEPVTGAILLWPPVHRHAPSPVVSTDGRSLHYTLPRGDRTC